ncbi:MAG TPA: hypothetical protein VJQ77_00185 [Novosphingobium sp.]|nr:hypothetical protein [Novosphingobium sp.]
MSEPRDFASLSSGLLARKGGAKPAMRPQDTSRFTGGIPIDPQKMEDLGWNDFGHGHRHEAVHGQPAMTQPSRSPAEVPPPKAVSVGGRKAEGQERPEVLRQIEQLASRVSHNAAPARAMPEGRRAAFTLRLDAERHFRLKMAGVVLGRSAQVIVTEALDKYLSEMPELGALFGTAGKPS